MPNPLKGEAVASFEEAGDEGPVQRELHLVLDNDAWAQIEHVLDRSYGDVVTYLFATELAGLTPKVTTTRALLYGATRQHHPELTLQACGDIMMLHSGAVAGAIGIAIRGSLSFKEPEPGEALPAKKPAPKKAQGGSGKRR